MERKNSRNGKDYLGMWGRPQDVNRFRGIAAEHFDDQAACLRYFVTNFEQFARVVSPTNKPRTY